MDSKRKEHVAKDQLVGLACLANHLSVCLD